MKKVLILSIVLVMSSCLSTRTTSKNKKDLKISETGIIDRKAPGDVIILPAPLTPKDRPKAKTETYKGRKGATATITYDEEGFIKDGRIDCPEISEVEKYDREMNLKEYDKQTKRELNKLIIKEAKSVILWLGAMFCIAWSLVSYFKN